MFESCSVTAGDGLCPSVWIVISGWTLYVTGSVQGVVEEMELSCVAGLLLLAGGRGVSRKWPLLKSLSLPSLTLRGGQDLGGERIGVTWTQVRPGSAQQRPLGPDFSSLLLSDWFTWNAGPALTDKPRLCSSFSWAFMWMHLHATGVGLGGSASDQLSLRF